ncbi:MAG: hypothetical protein ACOC2M_01060 [bacterium]
MIKANLFLISILLSTLTSNDNNDTKAFEDINNIQSGKEFAVADVTRVSMDEEWSRENITFALQSTRSVIRPAEFSFDYLTSNTRHNSANYDIKNKYATLPGNNHVKRKRNPGLIMPINRDNKYQNHDFLINDYHKIKRKIIV